MSLTPRQMHQRTMDALKAAHQPLLPLLAGRRLHYLDLPMRADVGELLTMAGTLKFFETYHLRVARMTMHFNHDSSWARSGDVLVFHGGGNFGDVHGPFQAFREQLIASRHDCRVIVMPQSLHFEDAAAFERCRAACAGHPDLHLCVRDEHSRWLAGQLTSHVYLMPDMAHQLWPLQRTARGHGVLQLHSRGSAAASEGGTQADWEDLIGPGWRFVLAQVIERGVAQAHGRLGLKHAFGNWFSRWWIARADRFIDRTVHLFSQHERIETDHLHAHVLATLLSMHSRVHDGGDGRNGHYIAAWTHDSPLVDMVRGVPERETLPALRGEGAVQPQRAGA